MILIDIRTDNVINESIVSLIKESIKKSLRYEGLSINTEVSVSIVDNEEIKKLNNSFREKDSITDVLSFPMLEPDEILEVKEHNDLSKCYEHINPETNELVLGDIVLSYDKAKEQATCYGHAIEREIAFLTIHSMLHLMGYDHMTLDEENVMRQKQREILKEVGLSNEE